MKYKFWKSSPTPSPVDSFAETAFSVDHLEGRHTPIVKLPVPARVRPDWSTFYGLNTHQWEDGRWNIGRHAGINVYWYPSGPLPVEVSSASIFQPEDVEITGEVKTRPTVRLPCPTQSSAVGAAEKLAQAPAKSVSFDPGFRLRRRGRLTRLLESVALEDFYDPNQAGGKTSLEWTVRETLTGILRKGVKLNWLEQVAITNSKEGGLTCDVVLNLSVEKYSSFVSMRLLNKLLSKAMFKKRTIELRASLTAKAVQFAAELGLTDSYLVRVLPGTVTHAMFVTMHEATSAAELCGWEGSVSQEQSCAISQGKVPKGRTETFTESFWTFVKGKPVETVLPHART